MPNLSQYQTVFRIAKPDGQKRSQGSKQRHAPNGVYPAEQDGTRDEKENDTNAQARLQQLEEMITKLL